MDDVSWANYQSSVANEQIQKVPTGTIVYICPLCENNLVKSREPHVITVAGFETSMNSYHCPFDRSKWFGFKGSVHHSENYQVKAIIGTYE